MWFWYTYLKIIVWFWPPFASGKYTSYHVDGNKMKLSAAYYDRAQPPLFRWWYGRDTVTVECVSGISAVRHITAGG